MTAAMASSFAPNDSAMLASDESSRFRASSRAPVSPPPARPPRSSWKAGRGADSRRPTWASKKPCTGAAAGWGIADTSWRARPHSFSRRLPLLLTRRPLAFARCGAGRDRAASRRANWASKNPRRGAGAGDVAFENLLTTSSSFARASRVPSCPNIWSQLAKPSPLRSCSTVTWLSCIGHPPSGMPSDTSKDRLWDTPRPRSGPYR